jgi:hypothetical protein
MGGANRREGEGEVSIGFWCVIVKERDHTEDTGLDGRVILRCNFR